MTMAFGGTLAARVIGTAVAAGLIAAPLGATWAQTVTDPADNAAAELNLPKDIDILGKANPDVRKATAIVNDTVITQTDVDQRTAFIIAANGLKLDGQDRERLRLQVLRLLIDETLQIQQAKTAEVTLTDAELNQAFGGIAKNMGRTPDQMRAFLKEVGSSERSVRRQIEGELSWSRYLRKRVEPYVNVGDEEVQAILDRLKASQGTEEFHLNEIYMGATPDRQEQVVAQMRNILAEIQKGQAPFGYYARNFSEASTRGVNGDLGWVRAAQLPDSLAQASNELQVGQIAGPVPTPGGFSILYLVDKRQVLTADPRDARLTLKQMTVKFAPGAPEAQVNAKTAAFASEIQKLQGCGSVQKVAGDLGAEVVDNDTIRIRDLPPALQAIVLKMQVGQATPPFGSRAEGVRTLVLCGRDDPQGGQLPGAEQVQSQLEQQRVNLRAQQALRDLRRDAVIDYR